MTIKEFAQLCGCNSQTLRYYDRIDLLKPVKVDQWSGYRLYDEEQAFDFVRIKNLQLAGFTIDEIKDLMDKTDDQVYRAIESKVEEQENKLRAIREIQKSYQKEMDTMRNKLKEIQEQVQSQMQAYDASEEFGIDEATYKEIIAQIKRTFDTWSEEGNFEAYNLEEFKDDEEPMEAHYDLLDNPDYELICEKHGWQHAKEFLNDCLKLDDEGNYNYVFKVTEDKSQNSAFPNVVLSLVLMANEKNPEKKRNLGCTVTNSEDGQNHFWLFKS